MFHFFRIFAIDPFAYQLLYLLEMRDSFCSDLQIGRETFPGVAIMMIEQRNTNGIGAVMLEQITDKRQVAQ